MVAEALYQEGKLSAAETADNLSITARNLLLAGKGYDLETDN